MDENKKRNYPESAEKEIVFSKLVKAGKRIYYLDVKKNRKDDMYLSITESKKIISGTGDDAQISFEKHKIFLYNEDLDKFVTALHEVTAYIKGERTGTDEEVDEEGTITEPSKIDIDIDF